MFGGIYPTGEQVGSGWQRYEIKVGLPIHLDKIFKLKNEVIFSPYVEYVEGLCEKSKKQIKFNNSDDKSARFYSINAALYFGF